MDQLRRDRHQWVPLGLAALGVALFLWSFAHHIVFEWARLSTGLGPLLAFLLDGTPPLLLVYGAYRLSQSDLDPAYHTTIASWTVVGFLLALGAIETSIQIRLLEGRVVSEPTFQRLLFAEIGGVAGAAAGYKNAQRQVREDKVHRLHEVATAIETAETGDEVYERVTRALEDILAFELAVVNDASGGTLVPQTVSTELSEHDYYDEVDVESTDRLTARAYQTGETLSVTDLAESGVTPADGRFRSALTVPIGDHGVVQVVRTEPGAFTQNDEELVDVLVAHARTRLDQLETERKLRGQTAELEQQNDRLEQFNSVVSHDLRNPLNAATLRLDLAGDDCDSDHLDAVARAHDRMETLIEELGTLARGREMSLDVEPVDLEQLTAECWEMINSSDGSLTVDVPDHVRADPVRLKRLLENLLRNAIDHGSDDVNIRIGRIDGGFYVADDGPGIPEEERERIFESGYSTAQDGTGFGLAIVSDVVDAHEWEIRVTESKDGGARFEITGVDSV